MGSDRGSAGDTVTPTVVTSLVVHLPSGPIPISRGLSYRKENSTALGTFSCRHPLLARIQGFFR